MKPNLKNKYKYYLKLSTSIFPNALSNIDSLACIFDQSEILSPILSSNIPHKPASYGCKICKYENINKL
jgi:hypothetical protein